MDPLIFFTIRIRIEEKSRIRTKVSRSETWLQVLLSCSSFLLEPAGEQLQPAGQRDPGEPGG